MRTLLRPPAEANLKDSGAGLALNIESVWRDGGYVLRLHASVSGQELSGSQHSSPFGLTSHVEQNWHLSSCLMDNPLALPPGFESTHKDDCSSLFSGTLFSQSDESAGLDFSGYDCGGQQRCSPSTRSSLVLPSFEQSPQSQPSPLDVSCSDPDSSPSTAPSTPASSPPESAPLSEATVPPSQYPCPHPSCDRILSSAHTRRVHMRTHRVKVPRSFICTMGCGQAFTRQHDRARHEVATHGRECPFVCGGCKRFFSGAKTLGRHVCRGLRP
ncbi:hypothetical protein FB45DRAFT_919398 [Roridomyces roridus]|uniref:C2H2-type domain-containing protein n=1 Tax=Roridomyces roridus TaxID=1738132 RepID=A0AAD7FK40_9AGAR|nr:hypothetical protein FB45DRAFT_919398 [Roridomyces roridus]